jgi:DNA-binding transcriptional MerR regulator
MNIDELDIISVKEACEILGGVSSTSLRFYTKKYHIPYKQLSCGRIFLRSDIVTFQENRKARLKHRRNKDC